MKISKNHFFYFRKKWFFPEKNGKYSPFQPIIEKSRATHGRVGKMAARFWMDPKVASSNLARAGTFLHFFKNLRNYYKNYISKDKKARGTRIRRQKNSYSTKNPLKSKKFDFKGFFVEYEFF